MKQKFLLIVLILIAGTGVFDAEAQNLFIKAKDGTENIKQLNSLQKFTFSNGGLLLKYTGGATETFNVSAISKLYFKVPSTTPSGIKSDEKIAKILIYPNPAGNSLHLQNVPEGISTVSIYRMDGKMVLNTQISTSNESIEVNHLASGLYVLIVKNQALKFIKQ